VQAKQLDGEVMNVYYVTRKSRLQVPANGEALSDRAFEPVVSIARPVPPEGGVDIGLDLRHAPI
jgi:hypothetical protein